ncbi:MAG: tetratricopeptide repeat protein [Candidatus Omnitrophota bacterium]
MTHKRGNVFWLALFFLLLLVSSQAQAEKVILKSGKVLEARIKEKTDSQVVLDYEGRDIYYETKVIETINGKPPEEFSLAEITVEKSEVRGNFETGLFLASHRKFNEAFDSFKKALSEDPTDDNSLEAIHILDDLRQEKISYDFAQALFEGTLLFLKRRYEAAAVSFQRAVDLKPDAQELYYNLGNLYNAMGQYRAAMPYFTKLLKENPLDAEVLFSLAFSYFSLNEFQKAAEYFERYVALAPQDAQGHGFLGASLYALGREAEAMEEFQKARSFIEEEDLPEAGSFRQEGIREIINRF